MSALLVFSMWPTGATRALAEAIAPQDAQEAVEEVYEPEAQGQQAVAGDQAVNEAQAADEAKAAAEAEAAAAAEAERAAAEQAAADQAAAERAAAEQAAADQAAAEQAAAEAEANRQVNVGIDVPNATLHYNGQAFTAPTESITVPVHAAFVFSVAPMAGYDLKAVKTLVNGQETELHADAQGLYTVSEATLDSNVTVKVITEPTAQLEPAPAPEVVAPAGDASQGQNAAEAPADEPKTDEGAADTVAPSEGSATTTEGQAPAGDTAAGANGAVTVAETGNGEADVNAVAATDTEQTVKVGQQISLSNNYEDSFYFSYTHNWSSDNEDIATVLGLDNNATVTGVAVGETTVKDEVSWGYGRTATVTYTIHVVAATPATSVSISGENSVTQFSTLQLTAVTDPAHASGTASWASSNEAILTVDESGLVTGLRQGTATVSLTFTNADGSSVIATKDITVEAVTESTDDALVYYLLDPTKDANSNDTGNWGPAYGTATVNVTGATWKNDKNCFDNVDQRVISWPNGTNVVPRGSDAWNQIYENYKSVIQAQLPNVEFTEDDVEEISLVPAKISKNNQSNPDKHLDCNVSIKCKGVALVKYYLRDAGSTQFALLGSQNYVKGDETNLSDVYNGSLPETKVVNGVTYTFSGWYLDQNFTQPVTLPYTVNDSTNFYAKYVGGYQVIYKLEGGTWGSSDATMYTAPEGSTQTVRHEPTRENYKFTGWTVEGLDNVTTLASGATFTMPSHNVTLTATWEPLVSYQVKYLEYGTNKELAEADTRDGELGKDYTETAKTIDGYHLIASCPAEKTHKIGTGDNTVEFLYEKDAVNYTVNYYLNGTVINVAYSDTRSAAWGSVVSVTDCAKTIDGYTVVPGQDATITVNRDGSNVINVYYYKNVALIANSAEKVYNGSEQSVSGFTGAPEGADFSAITVRAAGTNVGTYEATLPDGTKFADGVIDKVDATGKYIVTEAKNGGLLITPYADEIVIKIKGTTDSKTYNGAEQSVEGFTVESISTKLITKDQVVLRTDVAAKATGTNVGTYTMGLAGTSFTLADGVSANFTSASIRFDVTDGALTITKRPVTLKSADLSKEYDGTALVNGTAALETETGWAEGEGATYTFTGSQTVVGSSPNAFTYALNSNTKAENYTITKEDGTLTVKDRAEKYKVTIKANSATVTYDGKTHEAKGLESTTVIANGHTFTVEGLTTTNSKGTGVGAEGIDAGEYANKITGTPVIRDAAGNDVTSQFEVTTVDGKLTIAKRDVTIKPAKISKEYDGTPLVATDFEIESGSFAEGEGIESCTYGGQQIQVGTSESTIEKVTPKANTNLDRNYNLTKGPGALTVTNRNAKYEITVEAKSATATYDGEEHAASGLVTDKFTIKDKFTNKDVEYTVSGLTAEVKGTDAGTYRNFIVGTAKVTDPAGNDVTAQFAVSTKSGNLEIAKRSVTLTSADATKAYDGTALTNDKVTVSGDGFVKGQGATYSVTGFQTVVGKSNNTFTYTLNEGTNPNNYTITTSEGTLKVTANEQAVVVKVKGSTNTQLYDGAEHAATGYTVEGVTVDGVASDLYGAETGVDFRFKGTASAKRTDAGTTPMGLKADQFENINKNFSNVTFEIVEDGSMTITKRAVTLTSASASKTYDGTPLTNDEVTVSGDGFVMGQGATYNVTGSQTNAGTSANAFSYTLNKGTNADNYTITTHEGTLVVNPVMASVVVTIVGNHADGTYNGKELSASGYTFSSNNELYTQDKVVFSGTAEAKRTDAGKTDMGLKADQFSNGDTVNFKNVVFKVNDGFVDIAKAQVTLKSADLFKQYNGTALVNGTAALETETGWAEGEGATYTFTGSQTVVGSSPNAFTYTLNEGTKADNYNIDKTEGTLTVMNRDAKYEVTVKANSATVTYDGKAHEATGVEADTFVIDGATYTVSGLKTENPSKVDAGTYTNNISGTPVVKDADGNVVTGQFMVKTENGKLVINTAEVTLTSASGEWTYDGTKHSKHEMETVSGFAEGEGATFTYSASITNVGNVENAFIYKLNANTKSSNYSFRTNNGTLKMTPVTDKVTVTITGNNKTEAYDGTEKTVTGYTVKSNNTAYTEANIKFTGTAVAKGTVVGTYDMGLNAGQFSNVSDNFTNVEFIVLDGKLTITGGQIDVDRVDWRTQDEQKVYDGKSLSAHAATATDKNGNALKVEYSVDGKTWVSDPAKVNLTHFGHQTVMLRATGPNYAEGQYATSSEKIAITKRLVTLTSEGANKTYDGTALTNGTVTATPKGKGVGFVDGEGVTVTVTGSQTAVGESDNTFTYVFNQGTNPADYQVTSKYGKLIVTANDSEVVVTITEHSGTFKYDGTEKTVEGYDFAASNPLYTRADFEFSGDATVRGTDAGEYDMQLEPGDFKNTSASFSKVTFVVVDGTLTITPKGIKPSGDNGMTVGTLPDVVYNGQPQRQAPVVKDGDKTLVEGEDYELSYSADETGADVTNAGTVTVTVTGKGNYTGKAKVTYQILKRQVVLTSGSLTLPYDGKTHSLTEVSGWQQSGDTGFVDGEVADVRATGTVTYVTDGKVTNTIAYTELAGFRADNYTITKDEGTLEVTPVADKVTVTVKGNSKTVAYDGTEKTVTGYTVASISNSLYKQGDFAFSGEAVAKGTAKGTYTMGLKEGQFSNTNANFSNVEFIVEDGELTIEGGQIDANGVTWYTSDVKKMYDGTPLPANRASARDKHGNALTVEYSLDGKAWVSDPAAITATNVSDSATVQLRATGSNYAEGQYATSSEKVDVTMRFVTLTSKGANKKYDGTPLTRNAQSDVTVGGDGFVKGEGATYHITGSQTLAGESSNEFTYTLNKGTLDENYFITRSFGKLIVTANDSEVVVTITEHSGSFAYDGTEKTVEGYDFAASNPLYTQADFEFSGDATVRGTDAGTYQMKLEPSDFANTNTNFAEVEFVVVDSELTIARRTVTLTSADGAKVYDGIALTKNEQSDVTVTGGEGFVAGETLAYEISGTQTVVGSSENTFVATSSETANVDNYDVTYVYGTLTISAQSIVPDPENPDTFKGVTVDDPADSVYDGQQHKWLPVVTGAMGNTLVEGEDYTVSYDKDDFTNVTGDITVTITGMGNYTGTVTKSYKITKAPLAVAALSASKVYDGSALTAGGTIDGLVADETAQAVTSGSQTEAGFSANVVDSIAWGTALESNYYIASQLDGTLTVTPKGIAPEPGNGMTVGTLPDVVYNGSEQAQKPSVKDGETELVEGVDYDLTYSEDLTNAGTVTVTVTGKGNYAGSVDVTYQITPAALTVSTPSASKVYDGEALAAEGSVSGFVAGESAPFATTGSQTLVGSSTNTYAIDWAAEGATAKQSNYVISEGLGTLTVTETTDEIVVTPASYTGVYDGTAHGVSVTVTGLPKGYSVKSAISHAQATDVTGDAPVVANVDELVIVNAQGEDVTANLNIQKGTGTIAITPATLTVTTPSASKAYDGCALTAEGKVSGFVAGESATLVTTGSQTLVGMCDNTYELNWDDNAKAANYEIVENIGTLEVTQSQAAIVIVPQGASKTYDGTPLEAAGYDVYGLPAGFTLTAAVLGAQTNVGGSYAEVDSYVIENAAGEDVTDQFANVSFGKATLSVAKRPVTITSADATQVYNGAELTAREATVTAGEGIVEGETLEYEFFGFQISAGSSQNTFVARSGEGTDVDNYDITYVYGTLTVTPKGIAPEPGNGMTVGTLPDVVYNGAEQAQKPTVKDGETELVEGVDYDLTYSEDLTNAGTVTVTVTGKGNYAGSVDVTYQITPAALTVSTPSASKVYDGEALAAEGSVSGFVAGESAPFATTGSQTLVGSSTNTYAIDWAAEGATAKQSNYVISEGLGTLTVTDGTDDDPVDPGLVINKTHEDGTYALGDTVDFTLTATNVYGEARTMTFVEQEGVEIIGQTVFENVEPGTTVSTTARYTVTEADILAGGFTNTATVTFEGGKAFDGKDDVVVEKVENALEVTKTIGSAPADGVSFNEGETVSFVVTVTNKGNQTLKDVQVTDKLAGAFLTQGESDLIESLAPGETVTLHYGYTITANDLGKEFRNVAVATAGNGTTGEGESPVIPVAPMSPEPNPNQKPDSKPGSGKPAIPKTADETPDGLMAALANLGLASLAAGLACLFVIPRRREN
mgnify:CR=1 FL=1